MKTSNPQKLVYGNIFEKIFHANALVTDADRYIVREAHFRQSNNLDGVSYEQAVFEIVEFIQSYNEWLSRHLWIAGKHHLNILKGKLLKENHKHLKILQQEISTEGSTHNIETISKSLMWFSASLNVSTKEHLELFVDKMLKQKKKEKSKIKAARKVRKTQKANNI